MMPWLHCHCMDCCMAATACLNLAVHPTQKSCTAWGGKTLGTPKLAQRGCNPLVACLAVAWPRGMLAEVAKF